MKNTNTMNISINPSNKFAWVISGLIQSDGSFGTSIRQVKYGYGFTIKPFLRIELRIESLPLLKKIQSYFGCGSIGIVKNRNTCYFEILDFNNLWNIVLPHFINYPLYGSKFFTFIQFVQILSILYPYHKKIKPALLLGQVLYLSSFITKKSGLEVYLNKLNLNVNTVSNSIIPFERNTLNYFSFPYELNIYYIIGLIEGDGSFYVGLRDKRKVRFGFNLTTHIGELDLLYKVKFRLNCGNVKIKSKTWCRYEVEGNKMLRNTFIPLVDTIGLIGSKSINYTIFKEAMQIYTSGEYLTDQGFRHLVELIYNTVTKGKGRKFTLQEYLKKNNL